MSDGNGRDDFEFSPFVQLAKGAFVLARALSPMYWLSGLWPDLKPPSRRSEAEVSSPEYHKRRAKATEAYIALWIVVEACLVGMVLVRRLPGPVIGLVGCIAGLRILDITQVLVNATVFNALGRIGTQLASFTRSVVLAFVNIVELCSCFGVIYAADYTRLRGAGRAATGFYFSIITQMTIGYGDVYPTGYLRVVAAGQGLVGLVFFVLVFARVVASLPPLKALLEPEHDT